MNQGTRKLSQCLICTAVLFSIGSAQTLDISGYKVVQANSSVTITLPVGTTIEAGGYVVIGRNQAKSAFETAWQIVLPSNALYINGFAVVGSNGFPVINGSENYTLQNSSSVTIDGPTVSQGSSAGENIKRVNASASAGTEASWVRSSSSTTTNANPGSGMLITNTGKLVISEFSDAATFNNEFLELFYDVTPPPKGQGILQISPPLWKFNSPTNLQLVFKTQSDTLKGIRFRKPGPFSWNLSSATVTPDSVHISTSVDSVTLTNLFLSNVDSVVVTIPNVTASDMTDEFPFDVQSSKDTVTYLPIQIQARTLVYGSPRPISQVKAKLGNGIQVLLGKWTVIKGVVTVANEFAGGTAPGGPVYIQDATAGATLYDTSIVNAVQRGDEIVVLGVVAPFNDLFELAPCSLLEVVSEGNPIDTTVVTIPQLTGQTVAGIEQYEGRLVRINNIIPPVLTQVSGNPGVPSATWAVSGSGTNYYISDPTGQMQVRISPRINLANLPTPVGNFDLVCVVGQFGTAYQVLPRSIDDVIPEGNGPRFSSPPALTAINKTSLAFAWTTDVAGTSVIKYGLTTSYDTTFTDTNKVTNHSVTISSLIPATIYQVQFGSANSGGTTLTQNNIYSTASQASSGVMNVYFTKSVNTTLSTGENAVTTNVSQKLLNRIGLARFSIDAALYSLSGSVGAAIADSLIAAKNRGVKVRVIGEKDNQSTAPWTTLKNASIPVIDDGYDATNGGAGYMHNKFLVFDNRDQTSDADDWVWTGSWNATDPGNNNDAQNVIEIQDKALANAYTLEFNEMWGSDSLTPNAAASRFGARKLDNTPHLFVVNGTSVELYFSPSDRTTSQIIRTIGKANYSVDIALLSFTRNDIANAVISRKKASVKVHALADVHDASWSVFDTLAASGVDVRVKGPDVPGFLHHKYGIIDAEQNFVTQYVITGSHNWSSNAENSNNENTLIIQSNRIANLFLQEFGARYAGAEGTDVLSGVEREDSGILPSKFELQQNYPNPFNPATTIKFSLGTYGHTSLQIYNVLGQEVAILLNENLSPGAYRISWDASPLPTGVYFYRLQAGSFVETKKMLLMR